MICSSMSGCARGNALVLGKEDKLSLANSSRKVPRAAKELGGQLGQMYFLVSREHTQVRVTSGRNCPVYSAEKSGLILSISQLLCLHTSSPSRWFLSVKIKRRIARLEHSGIWGMSGVKMQASSMSVIPC